jgi:arginine utilization protein RocB
MTNEDVGREVADYLAATTEAATEDRCAKLADYFAEYVEGVVAAIGRGALVTVFRALAAAVEAGFPDEEDEE